MFKKISTFLSLTAIISLMSACGALQTASTPDTTATSILVTTTTEPNTVGTSSASDVTIDGLIALVNQYVASGDITGGAEKSLLAKLDAIKQKIMNGQGNATGNEFEAFINEVAAQQGKQVSDTAASALVVATLQMIAITVSSIPVTGASATLPSTTEVTMPTVTPLGDIALHEANWDIVANEVAQLVGFTTFNYDLYKLPANSAWVDTLAYYDAQAATAGWGAAHTQTNEIPGGHFAVWKRTAAGVTDNFAVVQMDGTESSFTLNIFGK